MRRWEPDPLVQSLCDYGDETCALGYCCQYYGAVTTRTDPRPGPNYPTPPHPSPR